MPALIAATTLAAQVASSVPPRMLDVRWALGGPPGAAEFERGHIPGAVYVDLDTELAGHGAPTDGRHPLPAEASFQDAARCWGLNDADTVIVYDDVSGTSAARAWWLLRMRVWSMSVCSMEASPRGVRSAVRLRRARSCPPLDE